MTLKTLSVGLMAALATSAALGASATAASTAQQSAVNVETLPSGVSITHQNAGVGAPVTPSSVVHLYYDGRLADNGKLFSSWWTDRSAPAQFEVRYSQPCFAQALPHLQVGETATISCPAKTVLGSGGFYKAEPAPSDVSYTVRIVSVEEKEGVGAAAAQN
ncbi:FKBP-type peptidyl-prolyl cis-trans isomerase [Paraburkholderia sp. EG287A]|uniref:FKBP-type peptidyl-prolyl cis-trans isomerase n=1 Tax=Paraburkholderia sp. EG287A TaxID=3237012 RepID=UPI0034D33481